MMRGRWQLSNRLVGGVIAAVLILFIYSQSLSRDLPNPPTSTETRNKQPTTVVPHGSRSESENCEDRRTRLPIAKQIKMFWGEDNSKKPKPSSPTRQILIQKLHQDVDPFDNFPVEDNPFKTPTMPTQLTVTEVKRIFKLYNITPKFVVEVGSYVGGSAIRIAKALDELGLPDVPVLCVDTWLGTATQWLWKDPNFELEYGRPSLYNQFMVNVINNKAHHHILPLVATGATGAHLLKAQQWQVDFLYLDAAHEVIETFREVCLYFEVLAVNGVMAGDDYGSFPAVKHDVDLFARLSGAEVKFSGPTWYFVKTEEIKDFTCWDWI